MADRMTEPDWAAPAHGTGPREHDLLLEDLNTEITTYRRRLAAAEDAVGALRAGDERLAGELTQAVRRFHAYATRCLTSLADAGTTGGGAADAGATGSGAVGPPGRTPGPRPPAVSTSST